jgi:3-phenylpropionate/trans-cinnamate dioxygenase ferredoxin subunit
VKLVARVPLAKVKEDKLVRVAYPPFDVVVAWADGQVYALEDACNHAGASLAEGWIEGTCVACPMHGYVFSLASGRLERPKGLCSDQRTFRVVVEGDEVAIYDAFSLVIGTIS